MIEALGDFTPLRMETDDGVEFSLSPSQFRVYLEATASAAMFLATRKEYSPRAKRTALSSVLAKAQALLRAIEHAEQVIGSDEFLVTRDEARSGCMRALYRARTDGSRFLQTSKPNRKTLRNGSN